MHRVFMNFEFRVSIADADLYDLVTATFTCARSPVKRISLVCIYPSSLILHPPSSFARQ